MKDTKSYEVTMQDGYILSKLWGHVGPDAYIASAKEALALREAQGVNLLLCDIRELLHTEMDIQTQTRGIGALWQIHSFDKVALLLGDSQVTSALLSALSAMHLTDKFKSFENQADAVAWLKLAR